jgi:hypothetical protein
MQKKIKRMARAQVHVHYLALPSGVVEGSAEAKTFLANTVLELIGSSEKECYAFLNIQVSYHEAPVIMP